jgi:hypothetical protein
MEHPKGKTSASLGGRGSHHDSEWEARQKQFRAEQRRLSGPCKVLYDRDTGSGAIPQNLAVVTKEATRAESPELDDSDPQVRS